VPPLLRFRAFWRRFGPPECDYPISTPARLRKREATLRPSPETKAATQQPQNRPPGHRGWTRGALSFEIESHPQHQPARPSRLCILRMLCGGRKQQNSRSKIDRSSPPAYLPPMETSLNPLSPKPYHHNRARVHHNLWNMPTEQQAVKAFRLARTCRLDAQTLKTLSAHWEVTEQTLVNIINRKTWRSFPLESLAFPAASQPPTESTSPNP